MGISRLAFSVGLIAVIAGGLAVATSTPAGAVSKVRCWIEPGEPVCPPCYEWNNHLCRCAKIPACKFSANAGARGSLEGASRDDYRARPKSGQ